VQHSNDHYGEYHSTFNLADFAELATPSAPPAPEPLIAADLDAIVLPEDDGWQAMAVHKQQSGLALITQKTTQTLVPQTAECMQRFPLPPPLVISPCTAHIPRCATTVTTVSAVPPDLA